MRWNYDLPYLNRYAYYLCGNWHDAEDLTSEAIIKGIEFANKHKISLENPKYYFARFVKWQYLQSLRKKGTFSFCENDFLGVAEPEQYAYLICREIAERAANLDFRRRPVIRDFLNGYSNLLIVRRNRHVTEQVAMRYIREFKQQCKLHH